MNNGFAALALAAVCALAPRLAVAEVTTFAKAGVWEAFGGSVDTGGLVCGVSTEGDGKFIGVKFFKGTQTLTIQLANTGWKARSGAVVAVTMRFDQQAAWKADAKAFKLDGGGAGLEFEIDEDQLDTWVDEFRDSERLIVGFPNDNVDDWVASLRGTAAVADAMIGCLHRIGVH